MPDYIKYLAIILAALILPGLCYIGWKFAQKKTLEFIYQERDVRGDETEIADAEPSVYRWRRR